MMSEKIKKIMMGKSKQEIAKAIAAKHKKPMAEGGMVDNDLDQEHERNLEMLMIEGDQPPVANPEVQDMQKKLAMNLLKEAEKEEYYAMGGLVEGADGDETPEVPAKEIIKAEPLSEQAKKALEEKKKLRKLMR